MPFSISLFFFNVNNRIIKQNDRYFVIIKFEMNVPKSAIIFFYILRIYWLADLHFIRLYLWDKGSRFWDRNGDCASQGISRER